MIPGGCTKFLQPADPSWNKSFKSKLADQYDTWMEADEHDFTQAGIMCAPSLETMCQWVTDAWSLTIPDMIKKLFVSCGITAAIDSSENEQIVCLHPDEMKDA